MSRQRFLDAIAETARTERPVMPWKRGARRAQATARRTAKPKKTAAAR